MTEPIANDASLPEHPDATRRRLREGGEWNEAEEVFLSQRERNYNRLRMGSKPLTSSQRVEANKAAWEAVYQLYPVPHDAVPLESLAKYLAGSRRITKSLKLPRLNEAEEQRFDELVDNDDHVGEVLWVYNNLENPAVKAIDCPSRGAWFMLSHARRDKGWFYEKMYRPVAQQLSKQKSASGDSEYKPSKAEKMAVAELDGMIKEAVEASQNA